MRTRIDLVPCALAFLIACQGDGGSSTDAASTGPGTTGTSATPTTGDDPDPTTGSGPSTSTSTGTGTGTGGMDSSGAPDPTTGGGDGSSSGGESETGDVALGPPVVRINIGGPAVEDFLADDGPESPYRASPDSQIFTTQDVAPDASVPAELPLAVLATGRVEPDELSGGTGQLRWSIPVEPGEYQLRLHFAGPSQGPGSRVVDVRVDDVVALAALDISALTAGDAGATVTLAVTADEWLDLELVRVPGSAMPLLAALELFGEGGLRDAPAGMVRHITVAGGGSGASLADAAGIGQLGALVGASAPGDEVWIHAGPEDYAIGGEISISAGGEAGAPVVIRGVGADWHDAGRPRLVGTRADPWVADGAEGGVVFRLGAGADHLRFVNLGFANQGNGCWRVTKPVAGLQLENIVADNVHRLLEDFVSGEGEAAITGLRLKDVSVRGYARAVARLQYDTSDVLFEDVFGDSEAQQYESFSTGITLAGPAHDVVFRRAVMLNNRQLDVEGYWNADGFSTERDNHAIVFEDTFAAGNTDGGYDLKSTDTVMTRATAVDNKRNFRLWGEISMNACVGLDPFKRGGSGTQAQLHINPQAQVKANDCRFIDDLPNTIVFDADDDGAAVVVGGCVELNAAATYQTVEPAASLMLMDVADGCG
ncbi:MAG TPA: malectin domain-containing carbohydrate-binding protein [Nannocystis sp.]